MQSRFDRYRVYRFICMYLWCLHLSKIYTIKNKNKQSHLGSLRCNNIIISRKNNIGIETKLRQKSQTEHFDVYTQVIESRLKVKLPDDLPAALRDGVVLCHLANHIQPRSVSSIHVPSQLMVNFFSTVLFIQNNIIHLPLQSRFSSQAPPYHFIHLHPSSLSATRIAAFPVLNIPGFIRASFDYV